MGTSRRPDLWPLGHGGPPSLLLVDGKGREVDEG